MSGREHWHNLRRISLEHVAERLGYRRDPHDRKRWKRQGSVINITGSKFFDHLQGRGGGGAIDLVIHGRGCSFAEAVCWLTGQSAPAPAAIPKPVPKTPFRPPPACEAGWPRVRAWLTGARGLEPRDLDNAHAAARLYADARGNAVFPCTNTAGTITGAEIIGHHFRGMARGSRKSMGGVHFQGPKMAHPATILITESAIDALSARTVKAGGPVSIYASTAGVCRRLPDWILGLRPARILCAFDSDHARDDAAQALIASDPRIQRLRPSAAKDWNDILRMRTTTEGR